MAIFHYFTSEEVGGQTQLLGTTEKLPETNTRVLIKNIDDEKIKFFIKYIDSCYIDENGSVQCDSIKVLNSKFDDFRYSQSLQLDTLRKFLIEAKAIDKDDVVKDILEDINDVVNCLDVDFSSITDIETIDGLCFPELSFNYKQHYINILYNE